MGARLLVGGLVALLILLSAASAAGQYQDPRRRLGERIERAFHPSQLFEMPLPALQYRWMVEKGAARPPRERELRRDLVGKPGDRIRLSIVENRAPIVPRQRVRLGLPAWRGQRPTFFAGSRTESRPRDGFVLDPVAVRRMPPQPELAPSRFGRALNTAVLNAGFGLEMRRGVGDASAVSSAAAAIAGIVVGAAFAR